MVYFIRGRIIGKGVPHRLIDGLIICLYKKYISIGIRPFGETKSKATRDYYQSGQYHTIVEGRDS